MSINQGRNCSEVIFLVCCTGQVRDMWVESGDDLAGGREENECDVHDCVMVGSSERRTWGEKRKREALVDLAALKQQKKCNVNKRMKE
jgi:hypothetical protein